MVRRWGLRIEPPGQPALGGIGLLSFLVIRDPHWLLLSMVGVGFAWASILSLPYALLSDSVPAEKMGVYMGIFNFFIVIPQLVAASLLGFLLKTFFGGQPIKALVIGGVSLIVAGLCVLRVREPVLTPSAMRQASRWNAPHACSRFRLAILAARPARRLRRGTQPHGTAAGDRLLRHPRTLRQRCGVLRDDRPLRQRRHVQRPSRPGWRASHFRHPGAGRADGRKRQHRLPRRRLQGHRRQRRLHPRHGLRRGLDHADRRQSGRSLHRRRSGAAGAASSPIAARPATTATGA